MKILRYLQFSLSPKGVSYANNKCNSKFTRNGCFMKGLPFLLKDVVDSLVASHVTPPKPLGEDWSL